CGIRRNHEQTHVRALLSADHLDNFVQPHLTNIDIIGRALCNGTDPVTYLKSSIDLRGPAWNEAFNFRVAVFRPKHGADANEGEAHIDAEILHIGLAQVFRMRVICLGRASRKSFIFSSLSSSCTLRARRS